MTEKAASNSLIDSESDAVTECSYIKHEEGGREAWLTVVGSFLVYYSSFGIINSFGFFQDFYQREYLTTAPPSTISIIGTLQLALMNFLSAVSGGICDAHGIKYLYLFSGLGSSIGFLALSFCPPGALWEIVLIQGLFIGITFGFGIQPACTVLAQHFDKKRAMAMGVVGAGSSMGAVCYSLMFAKLHPLVGFAWTMRLTAIKVLLCYSISLWISKARPTDRKIKLGALLDFRGFFDARYAVLALGGCFATFGLWLPGFHIKTYASKVYPSYPISPYLLPLMSGSSIPGSVVGGLLGDRLGRLNVIFPMTLLSGFICLSIWLPAPSISVLALFASLYGFTSGSVTALLPPTVSQILPDDKIGARLGAFYSVMSIATLTGAPIGAAIIGKTPETNEDYRGLIAFSGSALSIGSLVLFAARLLHSRDLRKRW
ncbi:MFS general substrate transporter [Bimuria novae-zelandiae CBS 107.79]|uniref:MFS general substrate transporter n=1 Tax=Bimuria novae-zelandiae CBS 107.79 TaxID=1447943 RepID=A0A6A5ULN5_9PLEO|nr:MFS general substrate transporter [Bimuria novae-zelandiae CBS 107.79]